MLHKVYLQSISVYTATVEQKMHTVSLIFNQPDNTQDKTTKQVLIQHDFTHNVKWKSHFICGESLPF